MSTVIGGRIDAVAPPIPGQVGWRRQSFLISVLCSFFVFLASHLVAHFTTRSVGVCVHERERETGRESKRENQADFQAGHMTPLSPPSTPPLFQVLASTASSISLSLSSHSFFSPLSHLSLLLYLFPPPPFSSPFSFLHRSPFNTVLFQSFSPPKYVCPSSLLSPY